MTETSFANPHGLDAPDHFSTARDMLDLTLEAMKYPAFRDIVRSRKVIFPDGPDGSTRAGTATNLMLGDYEGMSGVKTGFTSRALLTFVSTAEREGRRLYAVILGSDGRRAHFADAEELLDYGFENLGIYGTLSAGIQYVSREPRIEPGPLVVQSSLEALVHLSGQGLMSSPPSPNTAVPEAPQIPIQVVERRPTEAPDVQSAWSYWWSVLVGS